MAATKKASGTAGKKAAAKKATGGRKYSPAASASVEREMKAMKQGRLRSSSGEKVTNPKQAIAIALSEARREGDEMPPAPESADAAKKSSAAGKKDGSKKSAAKKTAVKKTAAAKRLSSKKAG